MTSPLLAALIGCAGLLALAGVPALPVAPDLTGVLLAAARVPALAPALAGVVLLRALIPAALLSTVVAAGVCVSTAASFAGPPQPEAAHPRQPRMRS